MLYLTCDELVSSKCTDARFDSTSADTDQQKTDYRSQPIIDNISFSQNKKNCSYYSEDFPQKTAKFESTTPDTKNKKRQSRREHMVKCSYFNFCNRIANDFELSPLEWAMVKCKYANQKPISDFLFDGNWSIYTIWYHLQDIWSQNMHDLGM